MKIHPTMNEEEVANMCFMALEDQDEVNSDFDDDEFIIEYEELLKVINKLDEKNTSLNRKVFELQKELDEFKENFSKVEASKISLENVNEEPLKKNEWLVFSFQNSFMGKKLLT